MSKKKAYKKKPNNTLFLIPLIAVLAIVPLIVYLHEYATGLEELPFFNDIGRNVDVFLYCKMLFFIIFASVMLLIVGYKLVNEGRTIKFSVMFIPLFVYALLAILSSIFSEYQPYPATGIFEQFESVFALLGYVMVAYYAFLFVNTEKDAKTLLKAVAFSMVIMLLIALSQAFFTDFFKTSLGSWLILPPSLKGMSGSLEFNFEEGRVYMTLYNPNYVGSYVALLFPVFMMLVFNMKKDKKSIATAVACIILSIGLVLALLGSQSRAGFVGILFSLLLLLVIFNRKLIRHWFPTVLIAIILVGTVITYNNYTNGLLFDKIGSAFTMEETHDRITGIRCTDTEAIMTYEGSDFHVEFNYDYDEGTYMFHMTDAMGRGIDSVAGDDGYITPTDERFDDLKLRAIALSDTEVGFEIFADGRPWYFKSADDTVYYVSNYLKPLKPQASESFGPLENYKRFASGRGFIWSKTLPLLKDKIFLGSGADTFLFEFPNDDFVAMHNGGYDDQVITKPHNMYLQMAVQTGVISLVAVLVFYFMYFIFALRVFIKVREYSFCSLAGIGILAGTFGYMIVQIINDQSITVAPIFWTLIGVGMALAYMTRNEQKISEIKDGAVKDDSKNNKR